MENPVLMFVAAGVDLMSRLCWSPPWLNRPNMRRRLSWK